MIDFVLFLTLGICLYTDLTERKIFNWVTVPASALGLGINAWQGGLTGLGQAFLGWIAGLFILFIPFMLRGISGGDIKLLAAIGALKGVDFVLCTVLFTAAVGGIYILIYLIITRKLGPTLKNLKQTLYLALVSILGKELATIPGNTNVVNTVPYAAAISAGTVLTFILR